MLSSSKLSHFLFGYYELYILLEGGGRGCKKFGPLRQMLPEADRTLRAFPPGDAWMSRSGILHHCNGAVHQRLGGLFQYLWVFGLVGYDEKQGAREVNRAFPSVWNTSWSKNDENICFLWHGKVVRRTSIKVRTHVICFIKKLFGKRFSVVKNNLQSGHKTSI